MSSEKHQGDARCFWVSFDLFVSKFQFRRRYMSLKENYTFSPIGSSLIRISVSSTITIAPLISSFSMFERLAERSELTCSGDGSCNRKIITEGLLACPQETSCGHRNCFFCGRPGSKTQCLPYVIFF